MRSCNHWCSGKAISIIYCEYVFVALGIHHALRMRHIVNSGLPYSTIFLTHCLINGRIFEKKRVLNIKFVFELLLQFLSETFIIVRRTERDMIKNLYQYSCEVPVILVHFSDT
jgi:hypothetical protein